MCLRQYNPTSSAKVSQYLSCCRQRIVLKLSKTFTYLTIYKIYLKNIESVSIYNTEHNFVCKELQICPLEPVEYIIMITFPARLHLNQHFFTSNQIMLRDTGSRDHEDVTYHIVIPQKSQKGPALYKSNKSDRQNSMIESICAANCVR